MKYLLIPMLVIGLSACTAEQAYRTAAEVGEAGREYVQENIVVRQEYRAKKRTAVEAEYAAELRAADEADRAGDLAKAKTHWEAAIQVIDKHMPSLATVKNKTKGSFRSDSVDLGEPLSSE